MALRVRATFIDISPDATPTSNKNRATSCPPQVTGEVSEDEDQPLAQCLQTDGAQARYINKLLERTMCLSESLSESKSKSTTRHAPWRDNKNNWKQVNASGAVAVHDPNTHYQCASHGPSAREGTSSASVPENETLDHDKDDSSDEPMTTLAMQAPMIAMKMTTMDSANRRRINLARRVPTKKEVDIPLNQRWCKDNITLSCRHEETQVANQEEEMTTLMICDIPCRQSVQQIISAIDMHGFTNTYNLVYMPSKRPKYSQNMGYAFVNFKTPESAAAFSEVFQNFRFPNSSSRKNSYTKPARYQGYQSNLERYLKQRAVGCLVTFVDGKQVLM